MFAQDGTLSGTVTDGATGDPLPGATVRVQELGIGSATDADGNFEFDVPEGTHEVQASFVGYNPMMKTVDVAAGETTSLDFALQPRTEELEEVVVVGYGQQQRQRVSGSVSSIDAAEVAEAGVVSTEQLLQGRASGVQVSTVSGVAGAAISVKVRGPSSIQSGTEPLYVIDGIPVISGTSASDFGQQTNALADLNPSDIQSIEILKDASATAIYGSRGANGVVLITTKSGSASGQTEVSFGYEAGAVTPAVEKWSMLNGSQWAEVYREGFANASAFFGFPADPNVGTQVFGYPTLPEVDEAPTYNWVDEVFQTGVTQTYNLSVRGGDEKTRFLVSGSYDDLQNYIIENQFRRINGRVNVEHDPTPWLRTGANLTVTRSLNDRASSDNLVSAPLTSAALVPPVVPIRVDQEEDGTPEPGDYRGFNFQNPWNIADNVVASSKFNEADAYNWRTYGNAFIQLDPIDKLTLRAEVGGDLLVVDEYFRYIQESTDGQPNGFGAQYYREQRKYLMTYTANYVDTFNDIHDVSILGGSSFEFDRRNNVFAEANNFANNELPNVASGATPVTTSSTVDRKSGLESYFSRLNYTLNDRYIFEFSARVDGSSRFGENNQYGFFPAGSVAWLVSDESFMEDVDALSELKLRASYGVTGNDQIGFFPQLGLFAAGNNYNRTPGFVPSQISNPDLKWERVTQLDVGFDLGLFNNRIFLTADYYDKTTNDLILEVPVPRSQGYNSYFRNVGSMKNQGVDLGLETRNLTGAFSWTTNFNLSWLKNEVTDLVEEIPSGVQYATEGEPLGYFNLIPYEGVDPVTGKPLWRAADGSLTTSPSAGTDRRNVGKVLPTWTGGLTNRFSYKGVSLSALLQFETGHDIYNDTYRFMMLPATFNLHENYMNRWQERGDVTGVPRNYFADIADNHTRQSTRWLQDGSYLRLRDVTLSYSLPSSVLNALQISRARIYVKGTNLLTFDKITDGTGDPEVNTGGSFGVLNSGESFFTAPQQRSITGGFSLTL
ncbi:SusC/RagA family TonB-linked outer membrane protein [Longibacter salinarum]|uniref:SusC/RagA family TonB-linked outer membrane protein n=1 Tax=Longibacter salinarum TaxID=1850348 RepID=UPI0015CF35FD|nr:TonB-dependent receptor [Longibacter salinarum]